MTADLPFSFGELLKTFRTQKRISQQQLAQTIGVHRNTISAWELGMYLPDTRAMVLELARHLHLAIPETRQLLEASLTAPTLLWGVPLPGNPFFTGREETLQVIHRQLHTHSIPLKSPILALQGMGGVGKTQVALEYAYRHMSEYDAVLWIEAETRESIALSMDRLAEVLQISQRQDADQQRVVAAVQRWLSTHSKWLLIWDNVEDLTLVQSLLPSLRQGAILITTRCQMLGTLAQGLELLPLGSEEGLQLLLRRAKVPGTGITNSSVQQFAQQKPGEYATAQTLVQILGGFPLALDQAGAYIEETGCSMSSYLDQYKQHRLPLLDQRGTLNPDYPHSVVATLSLAFQRVAQHYPAAFDLLRCCAFVAPDDIPEEFLAAEISHLEQEIGLFAAGPGQLDRMCATLRRFSLVQRHPETRTLSIHRLVQAVLVESMDEQEQAQWQRQAITALNALFPQVTYEAWGQCERLLTHALACANTISVQRSNQDLAEVLQKAADYLCERAQYELAEPLYQRTLQISEQTLGLEHPAISSPLSGLARLYREQGKYEQAEPFYQRALQISEQALEPEHPDIGMLLTNQALLYWRQGKYELAEPLHQRALSLLEQALGPMHSNVG
ncbi:MAG TPA: FxSxx-COOH system tetratricopeptide repeat protein, partial [Ktedonobacteraceae bacterium]|nr:FxSxx-COOH system tetratricopeptide repeat protein [Ktedonobacteraceae bacterium]